MLTWALNWPSQQPVQPRPPLPLPQPVIISPRRLRRANISAISPAVIRRYLTIRTVDRTLPENFSSVATPCRHWRVTRVSTTIRTCSRVQQQRLHWRPNTRQLQLQQRAVVTPVMCSSLVLAILTTPTTLTIRTIRTTTTTNR